MHQYLLESWFKLDILCFFFTRDCRLEQDVVVGSKSTVGTGSIIRNSVIGNQCVIGIIIC